MSKEQELVTEKIVATVRMLESLGFDYRVSGPKQIRGKGNQYRRIVTVDVGNGDVVAFYNPAKGKTFASGKHGAIGGVKSIEDFANYLQSIRSN
jgi:hypothetical protein